MTNTKITLIRIKICHLPNDEKNNDKDICSTSLLKLYNAYLLQSSPDMLQRLQLKSRILFQEYEDVRQHK